MVSGAPSRPCVHVEAPILDLSIELEDHSLSLKIRLQEGLAPISRSCGLHPLATLVQENLE